MERFLGENRENEGSKGASEGERGSREVNRSGSESTMAAWREQRHDSTDSRWVCLCVCGCGHTDTDSFCRFEMDYEMRGCLGRGGFGVVYHVSNRTDGGEYAVKRIKLPTT